jgi:stage II sporulation protein GA (sporulation sigma-E factor processing peptidase)
MRRGGEGVTVVYIDRVAVLNFLVDYLLLLTGARLAGIPLRRARLALWALLGTLYAVAVFLPGGRLLAHPLLRAPAGAVMALGAYWPHRRRWRLVALFGLLAAALAGLVLALGLAAGDPGRYVTALWHARISWPVLLLSAGGFYVLLQILFRRGVRHGRGEIMEVTVAIDGRERTVPTLYDTGNTLCDPVSGQAVLVLEQDLLYDLWPPEVSGVLRQALPPEEKMVRLHRIERGKAFSLLPFRSVGVPSGLLLAFRSDSVTVEGCRYRRTLLALSEGPLSDGGAYHALWGGEEGNVHERTAAQTAARAQEMDHAV